MHELNDFMKKKDINPFRALKLPLVQVTIFIYHDNVNVLFFNLHLKKYNSVFCVYTERIYMLNHTNDFFSGCRNLVVV